MLYHVAWGPCPSWVLNHLAKLGQPQQTRLHFWVLPVFFTQHSFIKKKYISETSLLSISSCDMLGVFFFFFLFEIVNIIYFKITLLLFAHKLQVYLRKYISTFLIYVLFFYIFIIFIYIIFILNNYIYIIIFMFFYQVAFYHYALQKHWWYIDIFCKLVLDVFTIFPK